MCRGFKKKKEFRLICAKYPRVPRLLFLRSRRSVRKRLKRRSVHPVDRKGGKKQVSCIHDRSSPPSTRQCAMADFFEYAPLRRSFPAVTFVASPTIRFLSDRSVSRKGRRANNREGRRETNSNDGLSCQLFADHSYNSAVYTLYEFFLRDMRIS